MSKVFKEQILCNELFPNRDKSVNRFVDFEIIGGNNIPQDLKEFSAILQTIFKQFNDEEHNKVMFSKNPQKERANIGKESLSCYCNKNFKYRISPDNETFYDVKKNKNEKKFLNFIKYKLLDRYNLISFPMSTVSEEFISYQPYFDGDLFVNIEHKELLNSFFYNNRALLNHFLPSFLHHNFIYKSDEKILIKTIENKNIEMRDYFSTHPKIGELVGAIRNFDNKHKLKL